MREVLFLGGQLKERIWGGNYFNCKLNKTNELKKYGEYWSVSAHSEGESIVVSGVFKGLNLSEIYTKYPEIFNYHHLKEFPILIKLIATYQDLSVQVHPNDEYSKKYEKQLGKTEGWLILDCDKNSKIVLGHNALDKEDLISLIKTNQYDKLLNYKSVEKGDFYAIPSGTLHALGSNIVLLEIQQSSDVTYRVYDYNRLDDKGQPRDLHIDKAIDVITYNNQIYQKNVFTEDSYIEVWDNEYFQVFLINVSNQYIFSKFSYYGIVSVVDGEFTVYDKILKIGDSFIISHLANNVIINGHGRLIITIPK